MRTMRRRPRPWHYTGRVAVGSGTKEPSYLPSGSDKSVVSNASLAHLLDTGLVGPIAVVEGTDKDLSSLFSTFLDAYAVPDAVHKTIGTPPRGCTFWSSASASGATTAKLRVTRSGWCTSRRPAHVSVAARRRQESPTRRHDSEYD